MTEHTNLFKPLRIGKLEVKNRYCAGAVSGRFLTHEQKGEYSQNGIEFEVSRARGGFGLIITGSNYGDQTVDPFNPVNDKPSPLYAPAVSGNSYRTLTRRTHAYGSKIFMQIAFGPGRMRNGKSCSVLPTLKNPEKYTEELTADEIERLCSGLVKLGIFAKNNGFDGVEIHAHFGYLFDQFEMECTNHRTDEYGGSLDNRLLVYKKVIRGIKEACGEDFPIAIRMGLKTYMKSFSEATLDGSEEFGRDIEETIEVAKKLEEYGIDMFDFNSGTYESHYYCLGPYYMPKGYNVELAARAKAQLHVPVYCVGLMDDIELCEKAIAEGKIDGVTICRAAMVDTQYAKKVAMNREDEIRPCIQCCRCEDNNLKAGMPLCSANPAAMQEYRYGITKASAKKKVVVVGSGIAGLTAAYTAAKAGHDVCILEQRNELGGRLVEIGSQPFKKSVDRLRKWYVSELASLGVTVQTGICATGEYIIGEAPDAVILATGSEYETFPGTVSALSIMKGSRPEGKSIAVIGGGCLGSELAYQLAADGACSVTLFERAQTVPAGTFASDDARSMLKDILNYLGVDIRTGCEVKSVERKTVRYFADGQLRCEEFDAAVSACGLHPAETKLYDELREAGIEVWKVGDCNGLGTFQTAASEAYEIAREI